MDVKTIQKIFPKILINPKLEIRNSVAGNGVFATDDISIGELLGFIPFDSCILGESEFSLAKKISDSRTNSLWSQYISFIVDSGLLNCIPLMWPDTSSLKGSLRVLHLSIISDLSPDIPSWAFAYMLSRSFEVEGFPPYTIASVPFGDLFNHSTKNWNTRIRECEDGFRFFAENEIFRGHEIFNNYGIDEQHLMMITHGFFDDGLRTDVMYISAGELRYGEDDEGKEVDETVIRIETGSVFDAFKDRANEQFRRVVERRLVQLESESSTNLLPFISAIYKSEIENLKNFQNQ